MNAVDVQIEWYPYDEALGREFSSAFIAVEIRTIPSIPIGAGYGDFDSSGRQSLATGLRDS